ncbi:MAG: helix-turn-helix domain-containing protein [Opitutales bacterium]|jgi:AraC-like DNA-binding protein|nr:helix-turn-helix domain-containing protein [Opitutales bacterium]MBT5816694.1 helix-turn-helix domain-containing protein [Opitutales bacterium]MBT6769037.1 helix-turn-helix domain-containing protein [Opitutales bacterium]
MQDDRFFLKHNVGDNIYSIFDDLPGYTFFVKDTKLRYVLFNERLLNLFGVEDGAQILGKRDEDFVSPHIMEEWRKDDLHIIETGKFIHNRVELVPSGDGFVDWSTTNKKPLYCARGVLCGVIGVTRPFSQSNASLEQNSELGASLKLMHQSFRDNIAITELAAAAHLSLSSFQRKFKSCFNISAKEYMRHLKVQEACHKIIQTTMNFAEISYACGFSDQSHFSREFTRIMKESPSSYRSRYKKH